MKTVGCLKDIVPMLRTINEADIQEAYQMFDFENEFYTCLGTSGKIAPSQGDNPPPAPSPSAPPKDGNTQPLWDAILKVIVIKF